MQFFDGFPFRPAECFVRKGKAFKHRFEIILVVNGNIPKHGLVIARGGRLVDGVHHLLEIARQLRADGFPSDFGTAAECRIGGFLGQPVHIVFAELFAGEIVEIGQKFHRRHRAGKLRTHREHQIDERTAERSQIFRRFGFAAQLREPVEQERIHGNAGAVGAQAAFVVCIDFVVFQLAHIFVCQFPAEQLGDFVRHQPAVYLDEIVFHQFGFQRGNVFQGNVGVGIHRRTVGGVERLFVVLDKIHFVLQLGFGQ